MANIDLFTAAVSADPATVVTVSDNRFRITGISTGNGSTITVGEYQVWTAAEAASFGYVAGGIPTTDPNYQVYRIF